MMHHANHFGFPIITFIDTPGAYAGVTAEELGQVGRRGWGVRGRKRWWKQRMSLVRNRRRVYVSPEHP